MERDLGRVEAGGMVFEWEVEKGWLRCEVSAPTRGWVAVGFNRSAELAGTNLIMGCVEDGRAKIEDRYIVRAGQHKSKVELGSSDKVRDAGGEWEQGVTRLRFSIPLEAQDEFSQTLSAGERYYVWLAYSQEADFQHHSAMRTGVEWFCEIS